MVTCDHRMVILERKRFYCTAVIIYLNPREEFFIWGSRSQGLPTKQISASFRHHFGGACVKSLSFTVTCLVSRRQWDKRQRLRMHIYIYIYACAGTRAARHTQLQCIYMHSCCPHDAPPPLLQPCSALHSPCSITACMYAGGCATQEPQLFCGLRGAHVLLAKLLTHFECSSNVRHLLHWRSLGFTCWFAGGSDPSTQPAQCCSCCCC